ncbi:MAG: preprotein translocase subunit SecA [Bacteroidales bacterium]|jgi:preprotein translocase subunit SecA|nr:preprotein translocase subunit SecA [Bacteroidales bacterium]MDD3329826.1 preprotein translocase subunit SecA [Bacteroidales bacterium]MDD4043942.1 preprotein translocase subunit SecA [Bacteroidales bacterium]NLO41612.1 preprotein translocase subunit SecA [Bacteroidales bacterium]
MANWLQKIFGTKSDKDLKELNPILLKIQNTYPQIEKLTNDELRHKTLEFKARIEEEVKEEKARMLEIKRNLEQNYDMDVKEKESLYAETEQLEDSIYQTSEAVLNEILPEAFAVMKETARRFKENKEIMVTANDFDRDLAAKYDCININGDKAIYQNEWMAGGNLITWDMCHYDVQLIGGTVLHQGKIAEMATGEGKTLVATLPVYLNALTGEGVHVVTVNDYLAKRDSEWMGMLYQFHGLSVDCIDKHEPNSDERRKAYMTDITFGTNNEFGFDYLRDNMSRNITELVQRRHNYAIVDEVDSVLIDDARTPLIISGPTPRGDQQEFDTYKPIVERLYNAQRQLVNNLLSESRRLLTDKSNPKNEEEGAKLLLRAHRGLPKNKALIKMLSEPGMKQLLLKTESFYMAEQNKNMPIIDDELYFVIEEKLNSVDIKEKGIELVSNNAEEAKFFIIPDIGSEIAELEKLNLSDEEKVEKKNEIYRNFSIASERIHTIQQLLKAYTMFEKDVEYVILDNKVKIVDEQTGRIMEGRRYSDGLHQAIEAKENVKVEAATQTYATITLQNYFRMYRKLAGMTGTAETEAGEFWNIYKLDVVTIPTNKPIVRDDREDLVYKTKREKYAAIVNEIIALNELGRPVLVGTTSVETSELLSKILTTRKIKHNVLNAKLHKKEADIVAEAGQMKAVTIATNMAGRGTDIKLGSNVKELGGLAIVGTERHDSRRVDRQLRGRAGRQGDPGSSQFFVSLEDDLMRLFGSDRIAKIMDRLGFKEGEVIQHNMISNSIERAQKKVEENNFGIRKRLLEYDDVMNKQRESIYKKRRNALYGDRLELDIAEMFRNICSYIVSSYQEDRNFEGFQRACISILACESPVDDKQFFQEKEDDIADKLYDVAYNQYKPRLLKMSEKAMPIIQIVYEREGNRYENIAIPLTDGKRNLQIVANLKRCMENGVRELALTIEKSMTLAIIDDAWKEHLREMDDLKQSVQNASYEQKDPLLIYKFESYDLFSRMITGIYKDIVSFLNNCQIPLQEPQHVHSAQLPSSDNRKLKTGREEVATQQTSKPEITQPIKVEKRVGRNEPCPCGSGKKYKNCHGRE